MGILIIVGLLLLISVSVGMTICDALARKSNQEWLELKDLALKRLEQYKGKNYKFVETQTFRFCSICDVIAEGGIFESKRNERLAIESTCILDTLKPFGFFNPEPQKE